ncbi:MAG: Mth938-like domain-containing protein [Geminicoccaceae bacterium]
MPDRPDALQEMPTGRLGVTGYRPGGFRIGTQWYNGHVLLLPQGVTAWPVQAGDAFTLDSLGPIREVEPPAEILLIGVGERPMLLPPALRVALKAWGLAVEAMPTSAACRTFNVLLAEERRVVAALLAIEEG